MSVVLDVFLLATCWAHVIIAPYTKVEESFNLHATHDVLMYGVLPSSLEKYDHFIFPGAVPRTFLGSMLLAWISIPVLQLANLFALITSKADIQTVVRLVLATCNALTLCLLRRGVSKRYGGPASVLFTLITCSQFHLPFWIGRTLPNMFALFPVNIATYLLLNRAPNSSRLPSRDVGLAIGLLTFTAVAFRSEVALLLGPLVLQALLGGHTTIRDIFKVGVISGVSSIAVTVLADSYFWNQWPLWAELQGVYFNVVEGKSSRWGVSPFHEYFTAHLPKLLAATIPFPFIGAIVDARIRALLVPSLAFITLLSFLGHKEWRFIIYTVPIFNVASARGATWLISRRKGNLFGRLCYLAVASLLIANCFTTYLLTKTARANYPGGFALTRFNERYANRTDVHVHISNLAAQTGASLFLQTHASPHRPDLGDVPSDLYDGWVYDKTEGLSPQDITDSHEITHVIAEVDSRRPSIIGKDFSMKDWMIGDIVLAYDHWALKQDESKTVGDWLSGWDLLEMVTKAKLMVLEKREV